MSFTVFRKNITKKNGISKRASKGQFFEIMIFNDQSSNQDSFGFLYENSQHYTLAWNGKLRFSELDKIVLRQMPVMLGFGNLEQLKNKIDVFVEFIITEPEIDFIELQLFKDGRLQFENSKRYTAILRHPLRISFARYDVSIKSNPFEFSFTAENPENECHHDSFTEIAIRQPLENEASPSLIRWIMRNHYVTRSRRVFPSWFNPDLTEKLIKSINESHPTPV